MCYTIGEIKEKTIPIAKKYGIKQMSLFGSYARGSANDESDVDIYIDKGRLKSLVQYFQFVADLESVLKCHVDVVSTGIEDNDFINSIKSEGVPLYEE